MEMNMSRGRKPKYADGERVNLTLSTTYDIREKLRDLAYDNHMSMSELITKWVLEHSEEKK